LVKLWLVSRLLYEDFFNNLSKIRLRSLFNYFTTQYGWLNGGTLVRVEDLRYRFIRVIYWLASFSRSFC